MSSSLPKVQFHQTSTHRWKVGPDFKPTQNTVSYRTSTYRWKVGPDFKPAQSTVSSDQHSPLKSRPWGRCRQAQWRSSHYRSRRSRRRKSRWRSRWGCSVRLWARCPAHSPRWSAPTACPRPEWSAGSGPRLPLKPEVGTVDSDCLGLWLCIASDVHSCFELWSAFWASLVGLGAIYELCIIIIITGVVAINLMLNKNFTVTSIHTLTPSLLQPVKFPGWKLHGCACKQYIFRSYNISTFSAIYVVWWKSFHTPVRKRKQKGSRVSNFAFALAIFKRHHGSEGVKRIPLDNFPFDRSSLSQMRITALSFLAFCPWRVCNELNWTLCCWRDVQMQDLAS